MPRNKATKRPSKLETLTDEVVQERWRALQPKAIKGTLFFLIAGAVLFAGNHFASLPQMLVNFINVAFQVSCVFAACGAFMVLMSQVYGRPAKKAIG